MPRKRIPTSNLIRKAVDTNEDFVMFEGYVAESTNETTRLHPSLSPSCYLEIPTDSILDWQSAGEEKLRVYVTASTEIRKTITEILTAGNMQDQDIDDFTYLQVGKDMQGGNRQYTLISNIMKHKHPAAKNAINNVR